MPVRRSCVVALDVGADVRVLRNDELDAVIGGVMEGGCIRLPEVLRPWIIPQPTWTFVDVFSHPTIG